MIEKQGVISIIEFPLGQDEVAISIALLQLFREGWQFKSLTTKCICITRCWEIEIVKEDNSKPEKRELMFPNRACGTSGKKTVWQNKEKVIDSSGNSQSTPCLRCGHFDQTICDCGTKKEML